MGTSWRCTGPRWSGEAFGLGWCRPQRAEERLSALPAGKPLAFAVEGERRCLGVRRAGRWILCPRAAVLDGAGARDQCGDCARLDRSRSVAADTMADNPRPYGVYLAYFGPGLLKVGITAAERGAARLLEQGAVGYSWLGRGPLMAARRAEALLGSALAVRDRFGKAEKRAARRALPPAAERAAAVAALHHEAQSLPGWPEALQQAPYAYVDHSEVFGLDRIPAEPGALAAIAALRAGDEIVGAVLAAAGSDLYLEQAGTGPVLVMDTRLLAGWVLRGAAGQVTTAAVVREGRPEDEGRQEGLF
ncbi:DUF2797 domain-containing protein [Streptomyces ochraceiscleroticus]|uniref:DUF2797 domain-containing protein n=1 Tax=Streptomyces ochraceiscleroticus TaxID=47761 RepID=A0ABW1MPB4_9ACTN|nr:DUF2797 domain-containing protein [Streptomyces ochraceiscleroticus]